MKNLLVMNLVPCIHFSLSEIAWDTNIVARPAKVSRVLTKPVVLVGKTSGLATDKEAAYCKPGTHHSHRSNLYLLPRA